MKIDVTFDFTSDTPNYWDHYWNNNNGFGGGSNDPDAHSPTLKKYHQILWSRKLPCGETMKLQDEPGNNYLSWNGFRFGSDSIIISFRHKKNAALMSDLQAELPDFHQYFEDYTHRSYTIGGMMIFPKHQNSINQKRGTNHRIADRWDLTMECIRRYYLKQDSPLYSVLNNDKSFFDLFVDFRGFVDYFYLQDCVQDNYTSVNIWLGDGSFNENPTPKNTKEYYHWILKQDEFLRQRNKRIAAAFG